MLTSPRTEGIVSSRCARDSLRKIFLAIFVILSSAGFLSYRASSVSNTSCRNGCFTNVTYNAYNFTLPINKWVEYCSLTPVPGRGISCSQVATEGDYTTCVSDFCPFLAPFIAQSRNYECLTCLTTPVAGESRISRIFKCSATYTDTDAVSCQYPAPQSFTALADNAATFKTFSNGLPVQWESSTDNGLNFTPTAGGNAPQYSFTANPTLSGNRYRASVLFGATSIPTRPAALTVRSLAVPGSRLLVSNGASHGMVEQYDAANGVFSNNVAPVDSPQGIVLDPADGSLLVASAAANQVLKFHGQTGAPLGVFVDGATACGGATLNRPAGLAFGPNRQLYVVDQGNNRVVEYDGQTGACLRTFASGSTLNQPQGLAFSSSGQLYVANLTGTVARFTSGGLADGALTVGAAPAGVAISPLDGNLYVTDRSAAGQVYRVATANFPVATPTVFVASPAGGLVNPDGLAFGPDNHLYVASTGSSQIRRFNGSTGVLDATFVDNQPTGLAPSFLAFTATATITANAASATFSPNSQNITLSATVSSPSGTVNSGSVVFTVVDTSGSLATQVGFATSPANVSNGSASATFTLPGGTAAGSYSIRAAYSGTSILRPANDNSRVLTVNKATPVVTWNNPANIAFGSALSGSQLNATANVPGTFLYTPPAGTVLAAGNAQNLFVQFNPTNSRSYNAVTASAQINVTAGGPATLIATNTLTRQSGTNNVLVTVTIANTGASAATGVQVTVARIGSVAAVNALPLTVANIPAGGSSVVTLAFPPSVGGRGTRAVLSLSGSFSGGSFGQSARVVLP